MKDITSLVSYGNNDDELLPLTRCACGETFVPWEFTISIYADDPNYCPNCGRGLIFSASITVLEVEGPRA